MLNNNYLLKAKVWLYKGESPWHFITIEKTLADRIKSNYIWPRRGFGSIPVRVVLGKSTWKTSIFPDKNKTFVLPLKKEIRINENIKARDKISIKLEVLS